MDKTDIEKCHGIVDVARSWVDNPLQHRTAITKIDCHDGASRWAGESLSNELCPQAAGIVKRGQAQIERGRISDRDYVGRWLIETEPSKSAVVAIAFDFSNIAKAPLFCR
jgi:hypothetical protein